jgi:hypothetical protein
VVHCRSGRCDPGCGRTRAVDRRVAVPVTAVMLATVAALTAVTGARTPVVWFKVCPVLLVSTAGLLLVASWP